MRSVTRLGEGAFRRSRKISSKAIKATCEIIGQMRESCDRHRVDYLRVVATSAIRDAANRLDFVAQAEHILKRPVEVISGDEEAKLFHLGVHARWEELRLAKTLIVDLGGGSAQLIYSDHGKLVDRISRPIGALRLKEFFLQHDPPKARELEKMNEYIDDKLSLTVKRLGSRSLDAVVVTSGTAAAVVCAANEIGSSYRERANRLGVSARQVKFLYKKLAAMDLSKRCTVRGIGSRRAEIIVPGVAVLRKILTAFEHPVLNYTTAGVRDGIIADLALRGDLQPAHEEHFHVFLCHNSADRAAVRSIADRLRDRGIVPWLDEEQLRPGMQWQRTLQKQIDKIRSAAVFVGPKGISPFMNIEVDAFIREFAKRDCPVIPVILNGRREREPELPIFLNGLTWVDFRRSDPDPMETLIWGITGERSIC